jgi:cbb3-type cytochrome oxidase subunit 1
LASTTQFICAIFFSIVAYLALVKFLQMSFPTMLSHIYVSSLYLENRPYNVETNLAIELGFMVSAGYAKAFKDYQRLISHCIHNTDFGIGVVLLWCAGLLDWIETNRRSHSSSSNNVEDNHKAQIMYSIRRYSTFINM